MIIILSSLSQFKDFIYIFLYTEVNSELYKLKYVVLKGIAIQQHLLILKQSQLEPEVVSGFADGRK